MFSPQRDDFRSFDRNFEPLAAPQHQPQPAVMIQQTEPPQTDNTLIETLTFQLHLVTIRKQRKKLLVYNIRGSQL